MRKPNGYGSIKRLSGNRRRPFVFVVSEHGRQKPVEYFATQVEAEIYAADYNKVHRNSSLADHKLTFSELYHRWLSRHIADTDPSASAICGYRNAFRHCSVLHGMPYSEIKYSDYQRIIDDMRRSGLSYSSVKKVRSLISLMESYAGKIEAGGKNYASLLSLGRNKPVNPHRPFSRQKINRLWNELDYPGVDTVLILLYTGMRVGEMLALLKSDINLRQQLIRITRSKTEAVIRTIPIHHRIQSLIIARMQSPGQYLITDHAGNPYSYSRYCDMWRRIMTEIHAHQGLDIAFYSGETPLKLQVAAMELLFHIPLFFHWQSMQLYHLTSTEVSMILLFLLSMRRGFKVLAQMMVMEKICDGHELHFRQILQHLETICVLPLVGNNNLMAYSNPAKCANFKS